MKMFVQVSLAVLASCLFITGSESLKCYSCLAQADSTDPVTSPPPNAENLPNNFNPKCHNEKFKIEDFQTVECTKKCIAVEATAEGKQVTARYCGEPNGNDKTCPANDPATKTTCCDTDGCNAVAPGAEGVGQKPDGEKNSATTHILNNLFYVIISAAFFNFF